MMLNDPMLCSRLRPIKPAGSNGDLAGPGSNVNAAWRDGKTPLSIAIGCGNDTVAVYLLSRGADPNQQTREGHPVLSDMMGPRGLDYRAPVARRALMQVRALWCRSAQRRAGLRTMPIAASSARLWHRAFRR